MGMSTSDGIAIDIPIELSGGDHSDNVDFSLINGKIVVGLCGYAKSGKDTIGKVISERLGFKRIAFGDVLKSDLNNYMKLLVIDDLVNKGIQIDLDDIDFLNPRTGKIKEILRPYMIWFGEKMKKIKGIHYWTNRALALSFGHDKIVITDVRRVNELELFNNNNEFYKKFSESMEASGVMVDKSLYERNGIANKPFKSLLVHVNQLGLSDDDVLTLDAIKAATEQWLFDHTILIDSRIPDEIKYREKHVDMHIAGMIHKFPSYFL